MPNRPPKKQKRALLVDRKGRVPRSYQPMTTGNARRRNVNPSRAPLVNPNGGPKVPADE